MGRWLFLISCLGVLSGVAQMEPKRDPNARGLGGVCQTSTGCQRGLSCERMQGVLAGQCSAVCNADEACREAFGGAALCLGADRCARACDGPTACPAGTRCNAFGWCER